MDEKEFIEMPCFIVSAIDCRDVNCNFDISNYENCNHFWLIPLGLALAGVEFRCGIFNANLYLQPMLVHDILTVYSYISVTYVLS